MKPLTLYVITDYGNGFPHLKRWKIIEERPKCWIVDLRGTRKVLMKKVTGIHYFTDPDKVATYLRKHMERTRDEAVRSVIRMEAIDALGDVHVLEYAEGRDFIVDAVERSVREKERELK